jgi:probable F420-dependent oxidoreductase
MTHETLDGIGIWALGLRLGDPREISDAAAELEELGYSAAWIPGIARPGTVAALEPVLGATERLVAATGIVNIWVEPAADVTGAAARIEEAHPGRTLIGLGISHAPLIGERYKRPRAAMTEYLDALDAADPPVSSERRVLAAIGPRMLDLARERALGSHTYLMPPAHTALARKALGPGKLLAPEQAVVLETDPDRAREIGRRFLSVYMGLPNYTNNLRRVLALDDADFADGGSDRLVDATVAWGEEDAIRRRIDEHRAAGADHVCIQVVGGAHDELPKETWRRLAGALLV